MTNTPANLGRTMRTAHAYVREFLHKEIIKPGELINIAFHKDQSPSLVARRTLTLLMGVAAGDAWKPTLHRITKRELRQAHKGNERISDILDEVSAIRFKLETISSRGRHAYARSSLFSKLTEETGEDDEGWIEFEFTEDARHIFGASDHYGAINRAALLAFQSKYAVTLYELGCLLYGRRDPIWRGDLTDLREKLGVEPGKLLRWPDFRRFILDRAEAEINQLSHFTMEWKERRQGRKVVGVELEFRPKNHADMYTASIECERPKVGRAARRKGTVETVEAPLPLIEGGKSAP